MSFRIKLLVTFVLYGIILAIFTQFIVLQLSEKTIKEESLKRATDYAQKLDRDLEEYVQNNTLNLKAINESQLFHSYYNSKKIDPILKELFLDLSKTSTAIMEFRYIDIDGNERIRIDRDTPTKPPYIVSDEKLQNKRDRYYFQETLKLKRGEYFFSKLDLNIEQGKITKPIQPVLRIGTPLFIDNEKVGILIINLFMKNVLDELTKSNLYKVYLIDKDGYIIIEPNHKRCWSRYLGKENILPQEIEKALFDIFKNQEYRGENFYAKKVDISNGEDIHIVVFPDNRHLQAELDENFKELLWVWIITVIISIVLSYFMSIIPARLKKRVDILNYSLKKEAQEREVLLSLFDLSNSVLFKWNNDANWSVSFVSKSVERLLGYKKEEFEANRIYYSQCIHHDDLKTVIEEVTEALEKKLYFFVHKPYRVVTRDGGIKWILDNTVIVRDESGEVTSFVGYLTDITDLKTKELELNRVARTDQLTKISNRVYLDEVLHNQYYRFIRNAEACSVILLDIDYFKNVNDEYGHAVGDKVLVEFAKVIKSSLRAGDTVGRWGGEEFLIILPHTDLEKAEAVAQKLCQEIREYRFSIVEHKTASCGVSTFKHGVTIEQIIALADEALYEAKAAGRDCVRVKE